MSAPSTRSPRASTRGLVTPLRGLVTPLRGLVTPLRGLVTPLRGLVQACHPGPTAAVTAMATAVAHTAGASAGWVAAAFLSGQLTTGWTNDWLDSDRDRFTCRTDKPVVQGAVSPTGLRTAALLAALCCVPLSLAMGWAAGAVHLVAVGSAAAYNFRLKASPASFAPYAVSFGLVPSIITLSAGTGFAPGWATAAAALLGVGAHLVNVLPDLEDDAATGIRGLPHRLGRLPATLLAAVLLLGATGLLGLGPGAPTAATIAVMIVAAAVTGWGLLRGLRPGSRAAFLAAIVVALIDVGLLVARGADL